MTRKKAKGPSAGDAGAPKKFTDASDRRIADPGAESKGSFCREEAAAIARPRRLGWRVVDQRLPYTREDALRCHFYGTRDLVISMGRAAWCAWQQAAHGVGVIDRPPLTPRQNRISPEHPDWAFSETSGQPDSAECMLKREGAQ